MAGQSEDEMIAAPNGDTALALERWHDLAEKGNASAQNKIATRYALGDGVAKDFTLAMHWWRRAAEQGFAEAQNHLGYCYTMGEGVTQDFAEGIKWYRRAAEQGHAAAQSNLGAAYGSGQQGVPPDWFESTKWYALAAEQGFPLAQSNLGVAFANGQGVTQDLVEAFKWYTLALESMPASDTYGRNLVTANRQRLAETMGPAEIEDARRLVGGWKPKPPAASAAQQLGHPWISGLNGDGRTDAETIRLKKAAEDGDPWAQTEYAIRLRGTKNPEDERESFRWLTLAGEQGDARAWFTQGLHQFLGIGTAIDLEASAVNLLKASLAGVPEAKGAVEEIRNALPQDSWEATFKQVEWPCLIFLIGPIAGSVGREEVRRSRLNDDSSEDPTWLKNERKFAEILFLGSTADSSLLDTAFGVPVKVEKIFVGRSISGDDLVASTSISLRNIVLKDGFPVWWKPPNENLSALASLIGLVGGREWIRCLYQYPS